MGSGAGILTVGGAYVCVLMSVLPRAQEAESAKYSDGRDDPACGCPSLTDRLRGCPVEPCTRRPWVQGWRLHTDS